FQAFAEIPTMAYMQVLTRRFGHRLLFAIGCGIYLAIFIAWAFVSVALTAALLKLVAGIAFALTYVAAVMIANDLVPAHLRATGQALMKSVLFGVAPILGSLGGGLGYQALGARAAVGDGADASALSIAGRPAGRGLPPAGRTGQRGFDGGRRPVGHPAAFGRRVPRS